MLYVCPPHACAGHDQPNFDRWHANATAATVAEAGGVPVNYLIRLVDGKVPGSKEAAPAPKKPAEKRVEAPAPAAIIPATPAPAEKPVAPITTPAPAATAPTTPPAINLITSPAADAKPAQQEQTAVKTNPESSPSQLPNTITPAQQAGEQQVQEEPAETPVAPTRRQRRPRVFILGGRRLMGTTQVAPNQALVEYAIKTNASEPWAVRETIQRKLMASAAGFGMAQGTSQRGFYTLLKEHGVGYFPSMWVDGEQVLSGQVAMEAPPNRFINGTHKNFAHKLYKHTDLEKPKVPAAKNGTNVTVSEPAFIMANRRYEAAVVVLGSCCSVTCRPQCMQRTRQ